MKFVVSGYYGFKNSGDDALLLSITNQIRNDYNNPEIVVLSNSPKKTKKDYAVKSVNRYNIFVILWHILNCDILISGGGTLIQDETSTKSLLYYLAIIKIAKFFRKKVMLYANGIGPLKSFKNIEKAKNVLNEIDLITLRDSNSLSELQQIEVTKPTIELTADPVFMLENDENSDTLMEIYNLPKDKKLMCVSVRHWKGNPENFAEIMADFCDYANEKYGIFTVFMPMQISRDYEISLKIKQSMKSESAIIGGKYPFETVLSLISKMYLCVGMRLHSLIFSANMLVPTIGLVYDPKIKGFLTDINETRYVDVKDVSAASLQEYLDDIYENYDEIKRRMKYDIPVIRKNAEKNGELMKMLLDKGND